MNLNLSGREPPFRLYLFYDFLSSLMYPWRTVVPWYPTKVFFIIQCKPPSASSIFFCNSSKRKSLSSGTSLVLTIITSRTSSNANSSLALISLPYGRQPRTL